MGGGWSAGRGPTGDAIGGRLGWDERDLGDPALGNLLDTLGRRSGVGLNRDTLGGME